MGTKYPKIMPKDWKLLSCTSLAKSSLLLLFSKLKMSEILRMQSMWCANRYMKGFLSFQAISIKIVTNTQIPQLMYKMYVFRYVPLKLSQIKWATLSNYVISIHIFIGYSSRSSSFTYSSNDIACLTFFL